MKEGWWVVRSKCCEMNLTIYFFSANQSDRRCSYLELDIRDETDMMISLLCFQCYISIFRKIFKIKAYTTSRIRTCDAFLLAIH